MAKSPEQSSNPEHRPSLSDVIKQGLMYGHIGRENAQRMLLNLSELPSNITENLQVLSRIVKEPKDIILPSLRQISDFAVNDTVFFKQETFNSPWQSSKILELSISAEHSYIFTETANAVGVVTVIPVNYIYLWDIADFKRLEERRGNSKSHVSWARFCANFEIANNNVATQDAKAFFRYFTEYNFPKGYK